MRPDLNDPEQRAAYQAELRGVARGWRSIGVAFLITGLAGLLFHWNQDVPILQSHLGQVSICLVVVGIVLCVAGIVARTSYHRKRMSQGS
jgi:undecaprenyl pyrophosphate phosphatase UppP